MGGPHKIRSDSPHCRFMSYRSMIPSGDLWDPLGNTYDAVNWQPKANWTFIAIEHLFEDIGAKSDAITCFPTFILTRSGVDTIDSMNEATVI